MNDTLSNYGAALRIMYQRATIIGEKLVNRKIVRYGSDDLIKIDEDNR